MSFVQQNIQEQTDSKGVHKISLPFIKFLNKRLNYLATFVVENENARMELTTEKKTSKNKNTTQYSQKDFRKSISSYADCLQYGSTL